MLKLDNPTDIEDITDEVDVPVRKTHISVSYGSRKSLCGFVGTKVAPITSIAGIGCMDCIRISMERSL